jgi:hypothetical protein
MDAYAELEERIENCITKIRTDPEGEDYETLERLFLELASMKIEPGLEE